MTAEQKDLLKTWIAAALWLGLILAESTAFASADNTSRILYPFLHWLFGVTRAQFPTWHFVIRKSGHFIGYFTLSVLLFRSWRATFPVAGVNWMMKWANISFLMTALVASLDEWHQTFLPGRTGTVHDVLLDSTAALIAQVTLFVILHSRNPEPVQSRT